MEFKFQRRSTTASAGHVTLLLTVSQLALACSLYAPSLKDYARTRGAAGEGGGANGGQGGAIGVQGDAGAGLQIGVGGDGADAGPLVDSGAAGSNAVCVPQPEICNGVDDDCDGAVDNGCPSEFLRGSAVREPIVGDAKGGSSFADLCANDELVTGLQVALHGYLDQISTLCQKYALQVATRAVPYEYTVAAGTAQYLPSHPTSTDSALTVVKCAAGAYLVGINVYQQYLFGANADPEFTGISILCAQPSLDLTLTEPVLDWTTTVEVGPFYGTDYDSSKATLQTQVLGMGRLAVGVHGTAGSWMDTVGLTSSPISVLLK